MRYKDVTLYTSYQDAGETWSRARLSAKPLHTSSPTYAEGLGARALWAYQDGIKDQFTASSCYCKEGIILFPDERRALRWLLDGGCEGVDE